MGPGRGRRQLTESGTIEMQFSAKSTTEEKRTAMRKKAERALKEKDREQALQREKTAKLRALRLAREAEES